MGYDLRYMYLYINTPKTTTMPPITRCRFDIGSLGNNQSVIANSWPCMRIKMNIHIQCQLDILQHAVGDFAKLVPRPFLLPVFDCLQYAPSYLNWMQGSPGNNKNDARLPTDSGVGM